MHGSSREQEQQGSEASLLDCQVRPVYASRVDAMQSKAAGVVGAQEVSVLGVPAQRIPSNYQLHAPSRMTATRPRYGSTE